MSSLAPRSSPPIPHTWLLRRADQSAVAVFLLLALAVMSGWWLVKGGPRNRLIEADSAQRRVARFQVDVNTADQLELIQLPGIGNVLSQRIIEIRQTDGPFAKVEELRRVKGIGPKILERIRPYLLPLSKDER